MKTTDTWHHGRLHTADRIGTSTNGNPRFRLALSEYDADLAGLGPIFTALTQSDASCSYDVQNIAHKIRDADGERVAWRTTKAGRVWDITSTWRTEQ